MPTRSLDARALPGANVSVQVGERYQRGGAMRAGNGHGDEEHGDLLSDAAITASWTFPQARVRVCCAWRRVRSVGGPYGRPPALAGCLVCRWPRKAAGYGAVGLHMTLVPEPAL